MIQWRLKTDPSARDSITSDSRLATKVIIPFDPVFSDINCLPDQPEIYSDSSPLLSQEIFTFILCVPDQQPPKLLFRPRSVFSPCPRISLKPTSGSSAGPRFDRVSIRLNSGPALESVLHSFPFSIQMLFSLPLPRQTNSL
jgi:hypothetical protein